MTVTSRQRENALYLDADLALSARTQYALRAMLALAQAQHDDAGPLSVDTIASRHGLPRKFLEKVIADLRTAGLVVSTRGARGGYTLAQPASEISVGDIIRAAPNPRRGRGSGQPGRVTARGSQIICPRCGTRFELR